MAGKKRTTKKPEAEKVVSEIADNLEHVFLAGLGALSNAQKKGLKTFDALVEQGETFRKKTTKKTESLIGDVQDAIREMSDDAQSRAEGLLSQVRGKSNLNKLQHAFDSRVADAMDRLNVPSKNDVDAINKKLDKIMKLVGEQKKAPASKPKAKAKTKAKAKSKKVAKKSVSKKAAPKKAPAKTTTKAVAKPVAKVPAKPVSQPIGTQAST
jgi:poly(hydroxyalkanoate) granule-associated protein